MKTNKCNICGKNTSRPIFVANIEEDGSFEEICYCKNCIKIFGNEIKYKEKINNLKISSPEELLKLLIEPKEHRTCECGLTESEFNKKGRFGCEKCYDFFTNEMEKLVFPFHNSSQHLGKKPKRMSKSVSDIEKTLKLRYAKAIELEEYEKCQEIKNELDMIKKLNSSSTSLDQ